jgi:AcrR family transcriptional regulator
VSSAGPYMPRSDASHVTRAAVIDAAAAIVSERGYQGLNMRALAERFGVAPMTLYRHVRTKEDLLAALADRMLAEIEIPPIGEWQAELTAIFGSLHGLLLANPELAEIAIRRPIAGENAYRGAERVLDALRRGGLVDDAAVSAFSALTVYTQGFALQQIHASSPSQLGDRLAVLELLPAGEFPLIKAIGTRFLIRDSDRHFERGLDALLRGLAPRGHRRGPDDAGSMPA